MNLLIFNALSWEQRKLSEMVGMTYGGGTPSTANDTFWYGDIPWIQSSNVVEDELFNVDIKKHISRDGLNHSAAQLVSENSVAVVTHVGVGKLVFMPYSYTTSQDFISLGDMKCEPRFLCYALYKRLQEDLHIVQGSAIKGITKEDLMNKVISVPQITEQTKIANTLQGLDHLITLHQSKVESWKNKKNQLSTISWEQRKLGEVVSSFEYGLNAAAKEFDGVNKYLRITDIDDSSRVFKDDDLTSPDTDLTTASSYKLHDGEILFARTGASVGKSFIYRESDGLVYFAGFLIRAKIKPGFDSEFVFQNTLGDAYEKYIQVTSQRSGQPGVNAQEYAEYTFLVPNFEEQKQIGSFLRQIDNLITLHHRKLNRTQICINRSFLYGSF